MAELLLEIGLEEIPARMIAAAEAELARRTEELLRRERLAGHDLQVHSYATPRRLTVHATGVAAAQPDADEQLTGPAWSIAFRDGIPGPAAEAFAKKAGVPADALVKLATPKGDYLSATVHRTGRAAAELLAAQLPREIAALAWPKNMYWRPGKPERYVRPVKWLLALLNEAVLPVAFAGVSAANLTYGHRILHGAEPVAIARPRDYLPALEAAFVLADAPARRHRIRKALDAATRVVPGSRWREDEPLIETVVQLTEWPSVVLGSFAPDFLALPEEVLVTVMRDHQKYFAVEDASGKLAPYFLAVLNTDGDTAGLIRHGNERVLRARFSDARFFWDFDRKTSLDARVELLRSVTFHKDLGSYYDKTQRTAEIASALLACAGAAGAAVDGAALVRAVHLAKVDLTTELVKEFTELQGIVGGLYAHAAGEEEKVAAAIYSQYEPASTTAAIPPTIEGQLLGLADRIGTIVDMFALGLAPTGSKDPYALRRAANATVSILAQSGLPVTMADLLSAGLLSAPPEKLEAQRADLHAFFGERIEFYLREVLGHSFDVVIAVLAAGADDLPDAIARAQALGAVRGSEDFAAISAAFKRSKNILRQASEKSFMPAHPTVNAASLVDPAESSLYQAALAIQPRVEALRMERNYAGALEQIATLRPHVDLFFDKVMVLVDDPPLRINRLALLALIVHEFSRIADFSEIVPAAGA